MSDLTDFPYIAALDNDRLTPIVRQVVEDGSADVQSWSIGSLTGGHSNQATCRVSGVASVGGKSQPWSVFLKQISAPDEDQPGKEGDGWRREVLLYEENVLDQMPAGLSAPQCYLNEKTSPTEHWLWCELIEGVHGREWQLPRFIQAARHAGQLNGGYLTDTPLPVANWLGIGRIEEGLSLVRQHLDVLRDHRDDAQIRRFYSPETIDGIYAIYDTHEDWLRSIAELPVAFGHLDANGRNLIARDEGAVQQTIAIDWEFAGIAPIGEELTYLVGGSLLWLFTGRRDQMRQLASECYDAYLTGLRDAGWDGEADQVRLGFTALMAIQFGLRYGLVAPVYLLFDEERVSTRLTEYTTEEKMNAVMEIVHLSLDLADEARILLR